MSPACCEITVAERRVPPCPAAAPSPAPASPRASGRPHTAEYPRDDTRGRGGAQRKYHFICYIIAAAQLEALVLRPTTAGAGAAT